MAPQPYTSAPAATGNPRCEPLAADTTPELEMMQIDDRLREEFNQLVAANKELLIKTGSYPEVCLPADRHDELSELRTENADLRNRLEELEQLVKEAIASEEGWQERQREYEALLEEKSEVIRNLHLKIQQLQEKPEEARPAAAPFAAPPQLVAMKKEIEEQRRQLEQDEEALMTQMREMELAMSRERAELARQRTEIKRMNDDLQHELETASRDAGLRDRLSGIRARHQESTNGKDKSTNIESPQKIEAKPSSGFFDRFFGSGR